MSNEGQNNKNNEKNELLSWVLPVIMLFAFPPVGILLLALKVLDSRKGGTTRTRHPYDLQREGKDHPGARTTAGVQKSAASKETGEAGEREAILGKLARRGRRLTVWGGILSAIFAVGTLSALGEPMYWLFSGEAGLFAEELFKSVMPTLCLLAGSLGCLWAGLRRRKQAGRYRGYLAMAGTQRTVSVSSLAAATGLSPAKVREDLADMLETGLFPQGFLDYGGDRLVLSGEGVEDAAPLQTRQAGPGEAPAGGQEGEDAVLAEIRAVNDSIQNEKLSDQIRRVEAITARILDYQKAHPEKAAQLHSFLSYYLPTTLKILRAYARLEGQEVAGENITAAMERIEGMMDKVVEGFEKQLDLLFQGEAMDITTDVEVLERMLSKDGLSDSQGLTLGI